MQLVSPSHTCIFKQMKLVLMHTDFMELFEFLVDKQLPEPVAQALPRLWMFCNAAVPSSSSVPL